MEFTHGYLSGETAKYVVHRDFALNKHPDVDARQCIYYAASGALMAIFELLGELLETAAKDNRAAALEIRNVVQEALDRNRETDARRVGESRAHFGAANASNDPTAGLPRG